MEIKIGDYGRMIFEMTVGGKKYLPDHWKRIKAEAEPLVRQLIALNSTYTLVDYITEDGKEIKANWNRIAIAQKKLWSVDVKTLKEDDLFWVCNEEDEHVMQIGHDAPIGLYEIGKNGVYVEIDDKIIIITNPVLKAPPDWYENQEIYESNKYWLEMADKLGV